MTEPFKAQWEKAKSLSRRKARAFCSVPTLKSYVPVLTWLPKYTLKDLAADSVAGLTVGMTVIPQSMAYASVADLPPEYGLYSAFMGCFVYCIFGGSRAINIGPTAIMALLTSEYVKASGPQAAVLLCFICGILQLALGLMNLGFLIDFISAPVISGFTSAAAIIISSTQLKGLLGVQLTDDNNVVKVLYSAAVHIKDINTWDLVLGVVCVILLLLLRKLGSVKLDVEASLFKKIMSKVLWLLSAGRNAFVVVLASCIALVLVTYDINKFSLTKEITSGVPTFAIPPFDLTNKKNETVYLSESIKEFGSGVFLVPLMGILEHIAIAKAFARGKSFDASQELIALGIANIAGSFVSSFPSSGSFSRTALNHSSGVRTQFGGVITGVVVLLAICLIAPSFHFIPKASLSAVIICAVIFMIEYHLIPRLWKTKKSDLVVMILTFFVCLFMGIEHGILIGIGVSLIVLMYNTARPRISIEKTVINDKEVVIVRPDRMLNFPSVEYLRYRIFKATRDNETVPIILDGMYLCTLDFTVTECVKELIDQFQERNQVLIFINLKPKVIRKIDTLGPKVFIHFPTREDLEAAIQDGYSLNEVKIHCPSISAGLVNKVEINPSLLHTNLSNGGPAHLLIEKPLKSNNTLNLPDLTQNREECRL